MQLLQSDGRFVFVCSFDQRDVPKTAGFRWDPRKRQWWTDQQERAALLAQFASGDMQAELTQAATQATEQRAEAREMSRAVDADIAIPAPAGLSYLPYQRAGIAFASGRPGVLIGDDMGLGKTIQAIGVFNVDPSIQRVLIICPASLKLNWQREWTKWAVRKSTIGIAQGSHFPQTDVAIINYDIVSKNRSAIDRVQWDLLIVDEAHALKNAKAQRTKAILGGGKKDDKTQPIAARRRVFMTGTPILNRPSELWTLVQSLDPLGLGANFWSFHRRYCNAHQTAYGWDLTGASNLGELQDRLRERIMIRRLKSEVLTDLPAKRRQIIELDPGSAAATVAAERRAWEQTEAESDRLRAMMALAEADDDQAAYETAAEKLRAHLKLVFEGMSKLRHDTAVAKVPAMLDHLREAIDASGKVIFFAHHIDVIKAVAAEFPDEVVVVTGQTPIAERQAAVDRFQTDPRCKLFIGNILAAGVGLTLTASAHVVFGELDWRPGIVTQAEDRAHRIGQKNSVLVQHLVFDGSLDVIMVKRILAKQAVIDGALDDRDATTDDGIDALDDVIARAMVPSAAPAEPAPRQEDKAPEIVLTPDQVAAVQRALRFLAAMDTDYARSLNNAGFSKVDVLIGHDLAARPRLSPKQAALGWKIARKYRRQLGDELLSDMGIARK